MTATHQQTTQPVPAMAAAAPTGERSARGPLLRSLVAVGTAPAADAIAITAIVLIPVHHGVALVLASLACLLLLVPPGVARRLLHGSGPTGRGVLPRSALVVAAALQSPASLQWAAAVLVCIALQLEPIARRLSRAAVPIAANLPGWSPRNHGPLRVGRLFVVDSVVALLVVTAEVTGFATGAAIALAAGSVLLALLVCADAGVRIRARRAADGPLHTALVEHAPQFALHWDATPGTEYQVTMWLPLLERLDSPFVVVVRNPLTFAAVAAATTAPVLLRRDPGDLDAVVVPSLGTVFYVNNAARNTHFVRFTGLEHVQLGHGDSDKAPSWSPVHRLYTHAFVSGQAAVDRFARNDVRIPDDLLTIVGRPQVAGSLIGASTSAVPTGLYAPTWAGANADSDHSSLPIGVAIVEAMLAQGLRVVYRPHPYTRRSTALAAESDRVDALLHEDARATGRAHLDSAGSADLRLQACFDQADLLVSDVSSVASDWLQTEKPFLLTAVAADPATLLRESSVAAGAYLVPGDGRGLAEAVGLAAGPDPLRERRRAVKTHVLGDHGALDPADAFLEQAHRVVDTAAAARATATAERPA